MDRACTNCPGATDHDTANCPLMTRGPARNGNVIAMRAKINAQAEHIRRLEYRINQQRQRITELEADHAHTD